MVDRSAEQRVAMPDPACYQDGCPVCLHGLLEPDGITRVHTPDCVHLDYCRICNPELPERYDCPIHGMQEGEECPRC